MHDTNPYSPPNAKSERSAASRHPPRSSTHPLLRAVGCFAGTVGVAGALVGLFGAYQRGDIRWAAIATVSGLFLAAIWILSQCVAQRKQ
jgi:hypothetical protein